MQNTLHFKSFNYKLHTFNRLYIYIYIYILYIYILRFVNINVHTTYIHIFIEVATPSVFLQAHAGVSGKRSAPRVHHS